MDYQKAAAMIRRYEGLAILPYQCPTGHLTIGYGHNLEQGITREMAEFILRQDIDAAVRMVQNTFPWWQNLNEARQYVLVDMCFNIGICRLCGFKKMLAACKKGDYATCSREMLNSRWAVQVGRRASELAEIMQTGEYTNGMDTN